MGDLTQRAVPSTESGTDPIGQFAAQRAVGVVDADETYDSMRRRRVGGTHRYSIADRAPTTACATASRTTPTSGANINDSTRRTRHVEIGRHSVITTEPLAQRWKRRARTVPLMLAVTVVGVLASPAILAAAAVIDLAKVRFRLPTVRVVLFLLQYGINDSVEILLASISWARAGFGTGLGTPPSIARHLRLQH